MYRIELEPGDVGVFRTVEEIATAIKSGVVTPRARIYHQATEKWLPIEFHPHYKKALELVASGGAQASSSTASASASVSSSLTSSGPGTAIKVVSGPRTAVVLAEPEPLPRPVAEPDPFVGLEPVTHRAPVARLEPVSLQPVAEPEAQPPGLVVPLDHPSAPHTEAWHNDFPPAEPRPIVRPRLRMELAGKARRPFLLALSGTVVVFSTQLGLTAAVPRKLEFGIRSLSFLRAGPPAPVAGAPAPVIAQTVPAAKAPNAPSPVATSEPESQGSPSFGSSSAFTTAAPAVAPASVAPPRHEPPPAKAQASDSIPAMAPAPGEIAVGAPIVPLPGKPAAAERLTAAVLITRYQAAYAAARAELATGFQTAGFANLFAPNHLSSPKAVQAARLSAGTASAYVAKYRRREAEIEQAYADSFAVLNKQLNWSADERKADRKSVV